jgi:hypothetical protein
MPASAEEILKVHLTAPGADAWKTWFEKQFDSLKRREDYWKASRDLQPAIIDLPSSERLKGVTTALQTELRLGGASSFQIGQAVGLRDTGRPVWYWSAPQLPNRPHYVPRPSYASDFCGWFEGGWLEHIVLSRLKALQDSLHLHSVRRNVYCSVDTEREQVFELDVVALRGYQLFVFSCGRGWSHKNLKLKLFEADMRARQLGGDQACVALVCCNDDPKLLEKEVRTTMDAGERIKVFGREHLVNLGDELSAWITKQSEGS